MENKEEIKVTDAELEAYIGGPIRDPNVTHDRHKLYIDKLREKRKEEKDGTDGKPVQDGTGKP